MDFSSEVGVLSPRFLSIQFSGEVLRSQIEESKVVLEKKWCTSTVARAHAAVEVYFFFLFPERSSLKWRYFSPPKTVSGKKEPNRNYRMRKPMACRLYATKLLRNEDERKKNRRSFGRFSVKAAHH